MPANDKQLRILHVSALSLWAMKDNAGMCCLIETLHGHIRHGNEVTIVVPKYDLWDESNQPVPLPSSPEYDVHVAPCRWLPGVKRLRSFSKWIGRGKDPYVLRWMLGMLTWSLTTVSLFLAASKIVRRSKTRFDIVYAHCEYAAIAGFLIRLVHRTPNVTRLYGTFVSSLMGKPLVWLRYPIATGGFLVPHKRLICANDGTRGDEVAKAFGLDLDRFRFWQDGVDKRPRRPGLQRESLLATAPKNLRKESKWILSCSRLSYWKRIDRMLKALQKCRQAGVDCQLLVAGDGPKRDSLEELADDLGVAESVVWLGPVPHDDVWDLMYLVDVFMITNDVTNRCNPLFEAIRTSLPVVSVYDQSTEDLLIQNENALLADRDDVEKLGDHLATLCSDEDLAARLRQAQCACDEKLWTWQERMDVEVGDLRALVAAAAG